MGEKMTRPAIVLCALAIIAQIGSAETWITLANEPMQLKRMSSCTKAAKNDRRAACDCCVIHNTRVNGYSPAEAAYRCNNTLLCEFAAGQALAAEELVNSEQRLKAMTIVDVDQLKDAPNLPSDGVLTADDVLHLISALYRQGYLRIPEELFIPNIDDGLIGLKVKPLGDGAKGFYTGQLFSIGYDPSVLPEMDNVEHGIKPLYILKETKKGKSEIGHLYSVRVSRLGNEGSSTYDIIFGRQAPTSLSIAKIAFDDLHFKIKTHGITRYFSLLQTAKGKSLHKHLTEFGQLASTLDSDDTNFQLAFKRMKKIFYRIGFAMSELHQKYADPRDHRKKPMQKTLTHGDLHSENIFWDDATNRVTLIDNETFALSLKRPSLGINDIVDFYMLHTVHTIAHAVSSQLTTNIEFGINDALWHELWRSLFDGYLSAYGNLSREQFMALYLDFRIEFFSELSQFRILKSPYNFMDQRKLKRFGPTLRKFKIKHHELTEAFDRLGRNSMTRYPNTSQQESTDH